MKNILITGAAGQLGSLLICKLSSDHIVYGTDHKCMDFTDIENVSEVCDTIKPDIILHCGAYTAVDKAEHDKYGSYKVNVTGTDNLVQMALKHNSEFMYISTDYVFNGQKKDPYIEYDNTDPVNWYGYTKNAGEHIVKDHLKKFYIVRTSWVYGQGENNFVEKILKKAENNMQIDVVDDQTGTPTLVYDLAEQIAVILKQRSYGIYHCSGEGSCSWYDFAQEIISCSSFSCNVNPVKTAKFSPPAHRPEFSILENMNLKQKNINIMKHWKDALHYYFKIREK